ncbi:hypothetical protein [Bacillus thuringiensis]|uniref:Uncharacterized protein n=1 Tax=Bacillus thuringiensis TaxID=1428 RepID=A0AAP4Q5U8_BACTU|nr:hypothetical protein [Bacillus thuringiensis]MDN7078272.1 hypothetical protein [Bacillus thuringiensis]
MYRKEFICSVIGFLFAIIGSILNMNIFSGGVLFISLLGVIYIYKKKVTTQLPHGGFFHLLV